MKSFFYKKLHCDLWILRVHKSQVAGTNLTINKFNGSSSVNVCFLQPVHREMNYWSTVYKFDV